MREAPGTPATILVYVGVDLIGDGLMKLPFVRGLRNAFPDSRITWLAGKGKTVYAGKLAPFVQGLIDEVIEEAGIGRGWSEAFARPLPDRRFDLILDTQRRVPTTLALRRIRHGRFVSGCAGYFFSDVRPPGALTLTHRKPPALIDQMLELVALARAGRVDAPLDVSGRIMLPDAVGAEAARLLPEGGRYVGLAPGAGEPNRRWPLASFMALGRQLAERGVVPVFLLGPGEREWAEPIRAGVAGARLPLAQPDARLDLEPLLTIALAARCEVCAANDSGNGHLLATAGVPLVWLCGPTPPDKFAPRIPNLTIIKAQNFGSAEMAAIPVAAVDSAIRSAMTG